MINRLLAHIHEKALFQKREPLLLAVSGGIDSVVMVYLFGKAGFRFGIAHINFQLRGKDADRDEQFVRTLAENHKVPCFVTAADTEQLAAERKISIQMAAREIRYAWLEQQRMQHGYHLIATAHHQDDVNETVLMNILRGTGIHGLHGIAEKSGKLIRPMLPFFKKEIIAYATENNIHFRQDASNLEPAYERNRIRLEVIPLIEKAYPDFCQVFSANIRRWKEADQLYTAYIRQLKKRLLKRHDDEYHISIPEVRRLESPGTVLYEVLKDFGFTADQALTLFDILSATPGKFFTSPTHMVIKDRLRLIISEISSTHAATKIITEHDHDIRLAFFNLKIRIRPASDFSIPSDPAINCLNYDLLDFPLILRKWKAGDYFYPLGMKKKKKVSDYLVDRKMPVHMKDRVYVLQSGDKIACLVRERIDDRFRVTATTSRVYVIR